MGKYRCFCKTNECNGRYLSKNGWQNHYNQDLVMIQCPVDVIQDNDQIPGAECLITPNKSPTFDQIENYCMEPDYVENDTFSGLSPNVNFIIVPDTPVTQNRNTTAVASPYNNDIMIAIEAASWKLDHNITNAAFDEAFVKHSLPVMYNNWYKIKRLLKSLSGVEMQKYACCVNSCMLFYDNQKNCTFCKSECSKAISFYYYPIFSLLESLFKSVQFANLVCSFA